MLFSVYVLRGDNPYAIFDRELERQPVVNASPEDYDCTGVFECTDPEAKIGPFGKEGGYVICSLTGNPWRVNAQELLMGTFADSFGPIDPLIRRVWPVQDLD